MVNSNKRNVFRTIVLVLLAILVIWLAYNFSYDCNTVIIPPLCRFDEVTFIWAVVMLSIPVFSLYFIIRDIVHKTFFKKGKKIIDVLLILALIYCTISVMCYIKVRIDLKPRWSSSTAQYKQINKTNKEDIVFLEIKEAK